ncbi:MAG: PH domain-containing protein [Pirellulaceae bacterium]
MKQAIAGVTPAETDERTVMTVWPSVAATSLGRTLGKLYSIRAGFYIFRIGHFIALACIPLALVLYFMRVAPFAGTRYQLTNRRVRVLRGLLGKTESKSIKLDAFDTIDVHVLPGHQWYDAGDLVFYATGEKGAKIEKFRLDGVSRPDAFRATCVKSHMAYVGVQKALQRELQHT